MSKALVTEDEAMSHLRIDEADSNLSLNIEAASEAVLDQMGSNGLFLLDSAGDVIADSAGPVDVPARVKQATLITLTALYEDRKGDVGDKNAAFDGLKLPSAAMALLRSYWTPSLA